MAMNIPAPVQILRYDIPENTTLEQAMQHISETIKDGMLLIVNGDVVLGTSGPREAPKTTRLGLFIVGTKYDGRVTPTLVPMMFGMNGIGIRLNTDGAGKNFYSSVITDIFPGISSKKGDSPFSDRGLLIGAVRRTNIDNISEYGIYWPSKDSTFPDGIDSSDCYVLHYADNGQNSRHFQFFMCTETSTPGSISDYHVLVYTRFANVYYPSGPEDWSPWRPLGGGGSSLIAGDGISITGSAVAVDNTVVRTSDEQFISGYKTFYNPVTHRSTSTNTLPTFRIMLHDVSSRVAPTKRKIGQFSVVDNSWSSLGRFAVYCETDGSHIAKIDAFRENDDIASIKVIYPKSPGEPYATAPSTRSTPASNEIITHDFLSTRYLPISGGTLTGGLFGTSVALSESTIDVSLGYCFTKTITAATTFVFTGVPSNAAARFSLVLTNGGSQTVTWPSSVKWSGGANPALAASGVDVFTFFTADGGTTWYGVHSVQGAA